MSPARKKKAAKKRAKKVAKKSVRRTAKRRPAPRRAKKVAKKKAAKRREPARRAKKVVAKKVAKRRATGRRAKKVVAKKVAKKSALKPAKKSARRPKLKIVPRAKPLKPAAPPEPQAFAEAKAGASAKDLVLFELVRARVAFAAAIQGMSTGSAEQPTAPGKWSPREMVLHLAYWDREVLPLLEDAYQHGKNTGLTHETILARNDAAIAELRHHDWDSARRLLQLHRERLMEEFQSIPEEPAEMWSKEHPVGKLARILTDHDRHHAEKIKTARTTRGE